MLGLSMILSVHISDLFFNKIRNRYIVLISFSIVLGCGLILFAIALYHEPVLFLYYNRGMVSYILINLLFMLSINIIITGFKVLQKTVSESERELADEKYIKKQMELKMLSAKLNPHFLFNSLNLIVSLLKEPVKAEDAIMDLSDILRYSLDSSDFDEVDLNREIETVKQYLNIQKMRFDDRLTFQINNRGVGNVPPLSIQPLVENSIKHNMKHVKTLNISLEAYNNDDKLIIDLKDSAAKLEKNMINKGTGLSVTKKRIENHGGEFLFRNGGIKIVL